MSRVMLRPYSQACVVFLIGIACLIGASQHSPLRADDGGDAARGSSAARPRREVAWLEGDKFQRQLNLPMGISWTEIPLRRGLGRIAANQGVAIWLDRRVDPGQAVDFSIRGTPLLSALEKLAIQLKLGVGSVGNVLYLGPPAVAEKLATVAALRREEVAQLPAEARSAWQTRRPMRWEALAAPHELLEQWASELDLGDAPLQVVRPELLPHDRWAAADFPSLPLSDRLSLLLAGFSLTYDISRDGSAIRLAPLPESATITRTFRPDNALRAEQQVARQFPEVAVSRRGNRLTASGRFEDLERIARLLRGEQINMPAVQDADVRLSLKVENEQVGGIVRALERQYGLTVKLDPALGELLTKRVTFEVKLVTLEELLEVVLTPAGITYRLDGKTLELRPAQAR